MPAARRPKSGQDATESAAGVDTDQMAKVEHISVKLGRVAFMLPVKKFKPDVGVIVNETYEVVAVSRRAPTTVLTPKL